MNNSTVYLTVFFEQIIDFQLVVNFLVYTQANRKTDVS